MKPLQRGALLAGAWLGFLALLVLTADTLGVRALLFAVLPIAVTGWLVGIAAGAVLGTALVAYALWFPLLPGLQRPDTDQILFLLLAGMMGPIFGAFSTLKQGRDKHMRASTEARFDPLTGLYNRAAFTEELDEMLADCRRTSTQLAILFVDLDRFKIVNDTFGHDAGDKVLRWVAAKLRANAADREIVGRLGGDEFVMALPGVRDVDSVAGTARKLLALLGQPVNIDGKSVGVGASIGISIYPTDGQDVDTLIKFADRAMYQVKSAGKNYFTFSTQDMRQKRNRQLEVERQMRNGMAANEFMVNYQPQFDLKSGRIVAFEALLRWRNAELGVINPEEFIPIAEESGMIIPLGHWLLREVCQQASMWRRSGLPPVRVAVNVSPLQFTQPDFVNQVKQALRDGNMLPNSLELEITEGLLLRDTENVVRTLQRLRRLEVRTVLDDFGTGYSSLSYLERLPIASLKIPQTFVAGVGGGLPRAAMSPERSTVIVEAICAMAHKLSKVVIAEGIETEAQRVFLRRVGCDLGQGFLLAGALGVTEAEELQRAQLENAAPLSPLARNGSPAVNQSLDTLLIQD